jgi:hypothetical protein
MRSLNGRHVASLDVPSRAEMSTSSGRIPMHEPEYTQSLSVLSTIAVHIFHYSDRELDRRLRNATGAMAA